MVGEWLDKAVGRLGCVWGLKGPKMNLFFIKFSSFLRYFHCTYYVVEMSTEVTMLTS